MKYLNIFTANVIGVLVVWAVIIAAGFSSRVALPDIQSFMFLEVFSLAYSPCILRCVSIVPDGHQ